MNTLPVLAMLALSLTGQARAQASENDPYAYDVRIALFPVAFVGGVSQNAFGSAGRAEADLGRWLTLQVAGRGSWAAVGGEKSRVGYGARLALEWHFLDVKEDARLGGTIYPEDTPAVGSRRTGTDHDLEVPISQKLGGPRMTLPEKDKERIAPVRSVQSIRVGADYTRSVQRGRPGGADSAGYVLNTMPSAFVGYSWGVHYNLSAASAGSLEVGFRRYFVDLMFTLEDLADTESLDDSPPERDFFPVGVRIGMEGTIAALLEGAPGVGLGYSLELGALPGESGVEGYLLLGLGLSLDFASSSGR